MGYWLELVAAVVLLAGFGQRLWSRHAHERLERGRLKAEAEIWGLSAEPGETLGEAQARIASARKAATSSDPVETARRALQAQRSRVRRDPRIV